MKDKKEIRQAMKAMRRGMNREELMKASHQIFLKITEHALYKNADNLFTYVSFDNEVDTHQLIRRALADNKNVFVPKVYGDKMRFHKIESLDALKKGAMGILEPVTGAATETEQGLMIVPGIAFDRQCGRIGFGGGYYDKYLAENPSLIKIAVAYDFQIVEEIAMESHDIRPDFVVTPTTVYKRL